MFIFVFNYLLNESMVDSVGCYRELLFSGETVWLRWFGAVIVQFCRK